MGIDGSLRLNGEMMVSSWLALVWRDCYRPLCFDLLRPILRADMTCFRDFQGHLTKIHHKMSSPHDDQMCIHGYLLPFPISTNRYWWMVQPCWITGWVLAGWCSPDISSWVPPKKLMITNHSWYFARCSVAYSSSYTTTSTYPTVTFNLHNQTNQLAGGFKLFFPIV